MKKRFPFSHMFFCLLVAAALFNGCSGKRIVELKKEKLFTIPVGNGLEEIGVHRGKNGQFSGPTTVLFKNGFFYIVDRVNQKVLKVTTPGDIILTLSKGESEIEPDDETVLRLKERKSYPFDIIGEIAVDSENNIYIEDKLLNAGPEKTEIDVFDPSSGAGEGGEEMYVSYILKFDRLGRHLTKIGKGGPGSEPFFYVYKMDVDSEGNLIVLTGEGEWRKWTYYKFDPDGNLLFYQVIESEQIFSVKEMEKVGFFILDLFPIRNSNSIVFWVSLYDTSYDTQNVNKEEEIWGEEIEIENSEGVKGSRKGTGKKYQRDLLYYKLLFYNIESRNIEKSYKWENRDDVQSAPTEELLGLDGKTNGFLWRYIDATRAVVSIFRPNGTQVARRSFVFEENGLWADVRVAEDGSVTGVKIDDASISFFRWRSDELVNRKPQKVSLKEFFRDKIEEFRNANR